MSTDDHYTLETPENIEVEFELAGVGSRFCAMLVDWLLMWLLVFCTVCLIGVLDIGFWRSFAQDFGPRGNRMGGWLTWANALAIALIFLTLFGYYAFFEIIMRGQTPGKRMVKLRAIRDDGTPLGVMDAVLRNLVRVVDFLPAFYAVGALTTFCNRAHKRLGDLAAGTIVIKERELDYRAQADRRYTLASGPVALANAELTAAERRLLSGFLTRRLELLPEARERLAERLARPLHEKYGGHYGNPEAYLDRLVEGRHHEP